MDDARFLRAIELRRERVPSFEAYPYCIPAIGALTRLELAPTVTFLVGENGSGKSTVLEAIAVALGLNAEGGTQNFRFSTRRSHSDLHEHLRLVRGVARPRTSFFLRAESYFNLATEMEHLDSVFSFGPPVVDSYGGRRLHDESHGESFFALFEHRFSGQGLYLLDEPESALSPARLLALIVRIRRLNEGGSQLIIATHSPILMAFPDAWIYELGDHGIRRVAYRCTEHYVVTRRFLMDPESALAELLGEAKPPCTAGTGSPSDHASGGSEERERSGPSEASE